MDTVVEMVGRPQGQYFTRNDNGWSYSVMFDSDNKEMKQLWSSLYNKNVVITGTVKQLLLACSIHIKTISYDGIRTSFSDAKN